LRLRNFERRRFRSGSFAFGHDQGADETNVFCRSAAGREGCCAEGGEAAYDAVNHAVFGEQDAQVGIIVASKKIGLSIPLA
jgi:hypothetical protein